jgi:hypothetical protein
MILYDVRGKTLTSFREDHTFSASISVAGFSP